MFPGNPPSSSSSSSSIPVASEDYAYYSFIKVLDATNNIDLNFVREKLQKLLDEFATEERFKQRLIEKLNYSSTNRRIQIKYFFWTLDNYSGPNPPKIVSITSLDDRTF